MVANKTPLKDEESGAAHTNCAPGENGQIQPSSQMQSQPFSVSPSRNGSTSPAINNAMPKNSQKENMKTRLEQHLYTEITTEWADLVLIACCFVSGVIDSVAFDVWGCFCSMQTGVYPHRLST